MNARGRSIISGILLVSVLATASGEAQEQASGANSGGLASLRGLTELDATRRADDFKPVPRDRSPLPSDYVYQPPLIPHNIRGYELSTNANKCLSCHSFRRSLETGATKISVTHYATREGWILSDVSPRRYFCLQCHVTQSDARELVENDFRRVESLR
jgi:nitrate reductase (cytochrome), electron transfer subunit